MFSCGTIEVFSEFFIDESIIILFTGQIYKKLKTRTKFGQTLKNLNAPKLPSSAVAPFLNPLDSFNLHSITDITDFIITAINVSFRIEFLLLI